MLPASGADRRLEELSAIFAESWGKAYEGVRTLDSGAVVMRFSGEDFAYDDGKQKNFPTMLNQPDIEDMFSQSYPLTNPTKTLPVNFDPGRIRVEALFKVLFGASEAEVARNCVSVDFCGHKVRFNSRHGAAAALEAAGRDLEKLIAAKPELKGYFKELGGTFTWRLIAGTTRLSNHSFGTAIDLDVSKSAYWRWESADSLATFSRANWPTEIIETFERHGFIWGGKWWHYDTMHFEFRPDLIAWSRKFPSEPKPGPPGDEREAPEKKVSRAVEKFERPPNF